MIKIEELNVYFGRGAAAVHAVQNLSLQVNEGESFGMVGESGSGKSTVLRAIAGLNRNYFGRIHINRSLLRQKRQREFYEHVQMVFQDPYGSLHPRHTIDQTLREPLIVHNRDSVEQRVGEILSDVGLGVEYRYRFPHQLSGGQRQRVAIARALILGPKIILLDEPTSALDVSVQAEILNLLRRLQRDYGLTYVLVSHNLAVISHMCSRLIVMKQGRLVEELSVAQLRDSKALDSYTQELIKASYGYRRHSTKPCVDTVEIAKGGVDSLGVE